MALENLLKMKKQDGLVQNAEALFVFIRDIAIAVEKKPNKKGRS